MTNAGTPKAGLQGSTKTLAIELGRFGITANCIAPGFSQPQMTKPTAQPLEQNRDRYLADRALGVPAGQARLPEDIAHAVSSLISEGWGLVSRQVLYVAGGPRA